MDKKTTVIINQGDDSVDTAIALAIVLTAKNSSDPMEELEDIMMNRKAVEVKSSVGLEDVDADTILIKVNLEPKDASNLAGRVLHNAEEAWQQYGAKIVKHRSERKKFYNEIIVPMLAETSFLHNASQVTKHYCKAVAKHYAQAMDFIEMDPTMMSPVEVMAEWLMTFFTLRKNY